MTTELKVTIAKHAAGNYRVMMTSPTNCSSLPPNEISRNSMKKLYFDVFQVPAATAKRPAGKKR